MEPDRDGVVADAEVLGDLAVVQPGTVPKGEDLLVGLPEYPARVEEPLDPFIPNDALFLGRHVRYEIRDPIQGNVERTSPAKSPEVVRHRVTGDAEQPRLGGRDLRIVPVDGPEGLHEDLRGHVP